MPFAIVREHQPLVRCCAVLPSRPDHALGYEYLPEESVSAARFAEIVSDIATRRARRGRPGPPAMRQRRLPDLIVWLGLAPAEAFGAPGARVAR